MSKFVSDLHIRALRHDELSGSRQIYELEAELVYFSDLVGRITVPVGFRTDFASIPRAAFVYIDPEDPVILYPSVIHDYGYSLNGKLPDREIPLTREQVDQVLQEAMGICGARWGQKKVVYSAVRFGGGFHWKE